jgi:hypothetical protein
MRSMLFCAEGTENELTALDTARPVVAVSIGLPLFRKGMLEHAARIGSASGYLTMSEASPLENMMANHHM